MSLRLRCRLCNELVRKSNVLYESDNFFIVPALGQLGIEGYLLICSKEHYLGCCGIPPEMDSEFEEVIKKTKETIEKRYQIAPYVFEHGPKKDRMGGGVTLDHAHVHVVPTRVNIQDFLYEIGDVKQLSNLSVLRDVLRNNGTYIFVENPEGNRKYVDVHQKLPSQYLRKKIAESLNRTNWDWKTNPDKETFERTLAALKGKF